MEIVLIVFITLGIGLTVAGLCYEPEKPKKKLPDYVVMADDGSDE